MLSVVPRATNVGVSLFGSYQNTIKRRLFICIQYNLVMEKELKCIHINNEFNQKGISDSFAAVQSILFSPKVI